MYRLGACRLFFGKRCSELVKVNRIGEINNLKNPNNIKCLQSVMLKLRLLSGYRLGPQQDIKQNCLRNNFKIIPLDFS